MILLDSPLEVLQNGFYYREIRILREWRSHLVFRIVWMRLSFDSSYISLGAVYSLHIRQFSGVEECFEIGNDCGAIH